VRGAFSLLAFKQCEEPSSKLIVPQTTWMILAREYTQWLGRLAGSIHHLAVGLLPHQVTI
jgi:hypothetical protein